MRAFLVSAIAVAAVSPGNAWSAPGEGDKTAARDTMATKRHVVLAEYVSPGDSLSPLRYFADGLVTLNDRCAVRHTRLNPKMGAAYVNGRPIGFC